MIQSNPIETDLKGLTFFSVVGGLLLLPIYKIKESPFTDSGAKKTVSIIGGIMLLAGPV